MKIDGLKVAKFWATIKHAGQSYGMVPYTHHLAAVEAVLRRFGIDDEDMLVAAWCHDAVEDTGTKLKEVREMFGPRVAELVDAVTKVSHDADGRKLNRKMAGLLTYPKTRSVVGGVTLKLADRIANVENGGDLVNMYGKEYEDFRRALYTPLPMISGLLDLATEAMWKRLDQLLSTDEDMEKEAGDT